MTSSIKNENAIVLKQESPYAFMKNKTTDYSGLTLKEVFQAFGFKEDDTVKIAYRTESSFHCSSYRLNEFLAEELNDTTNYYIGVSTHDGSCSFGKKNMCNIVELVLDIDYGSDGHKKESDYSSAEEALEALDQLPRPTVVISTGGGFHIHYRLKERLDVRKYQEEYETFSKALAALAGADSCQSVEHIFRIPFTKNIKPGAPVRDVEVYAFNPEMEYTLDELKRFVPDCKAVSKLVLKKRRKSKLSRKRKGEDRSAMCFKYIGKMLEKHTEERKIVAQLKQKSCFKHYGEKENPDDECRKDIRRIRAKLSEDNVPMPKNEVVKYEVNDLTISSEMQEMRERFDEIIYDTSSDKLAVAMKVLEKLFLDGEKAILSFPCAAGKSTASIILAAAYASPERRFWIVVEKVRDVKYVAELLRELGAKALEWHGHNKECCNCEYTWEEYQKQRVSDTCGKCLNFECTAKHKNLSPNKWDNEDYDILVTTHAHWHSAILAGEIPRSVKTVIVDEAPSLLEQYSMTSDIIDKIKKVLFENKEQINCLDNDYQYMLNRVNDGSCKKFFPPNIMQKNSELRKLLFKKRGQEQISEDEFGEMLHFLNFFNVESGNIYGMLECPSGEEKELSFIRGTVKVNTDIQHIILNGSAKMSDTYWEGFKIYECDELKQEYPNTQIHLIYGNPSKKRLGDKSIFENVIDITLSLVDENDTLLVFSNKNFSSCDAPLKANIDKLKNIISQENIQSVNMHRGEHIGSNKGRECSVCVVCMSIFSKLSTYVLRTAIVNDEDIAAERIWNSGQVFKAPNMRKNGGFSDDAIQQTYCREISMNLYQTIMRGIIRKDPNADYKVVCLASGLDILKVLKNDLAGAKFIHCNDDIVAKLEAGESVANIVKEMDDEQNESTKYRKVEAIKDVIYGVIAQK